MFGEMSMWCEKERRGKKRERNRERRGTGQEGKEEKGRTGERKRRRAIEKENERRYGRG